MDKNLCGQSHKYYVQVTALNWGRKRALSSQLSSSLELEL